MDLYQKFPIEVNETWRRIDKIKNILSLDDSDIAQAMGKSVHNLKSQRSRNSCPSISEAIGLSSFLSITPENLFFGVDYLALKNHFEGFTSYLPDSFDTIKTSKGRTLSNILSILDKNQADWVIKYLQLGNVNQFFQSDYDVSVVLINDVLKLIPKDKKSQIFNAGVQNVISRQNESMVKLFKEQGSIKKCYQLLNDIVTSTIEKNWDYQTLKLTDNEWKLSVKPRSCTSEKLHLIDYGSEEFHLMQLGFAASIPTLFGAPLAKAALVESKYSGSSESILRFEYSNPRLLNSHFLQ